MVLYNTAQCVIVFPKEAHTVHVFHVIVELQADVFANLYVSCIISLNFAVGATGLLITC